MTAALVLVVDDDADILEAIGDILEGEGYRVARARHGVEALEQVDAERPAVILLDLMMPVISADGNRARASAVDAVGYLAKPFDIDALLAWVAELARGSPGSGTR